MISEKIKIRQIDGLLIKVRDDADSSDYNLNPDIPFTRSLIEGLLINQERYGYQACPVLINQWHHPFRLFLQA